MVRTREQKDTEDENNGRTRLQAEMNNLKAMKCPKYMIFILSKSSQYEISMLLTSIKKNSMTCWLQFGKRFYTIGKEVNELGNAFAVRLKVLLTRQHES